jgi:hypothetical protein
MLVLPGFLIYPWFDEVSDPKYSKYPATVRTEDWTGLIDGPSGGKISCPILPNKRL